MFRIFSVHHNFLLCVQICHSYLSVSWNIFWLPMIRWIWLDWLWQWYLVFTLFGYFDEIKRYSTCRVVLVFACGFEWSYYWFRKQKFLGWFELFDFQRLLRYFKSLFQEITRLRIVLLKIFLILLTNVVFKLGRICLSFLAFNQINIFVFPARHFLDLLN